MIWMCFINERLRLLIVYNDEEIEMNEYEDIIYNDLFSLINNLLEPPKDFKAIQVADEHMYLFM